MKINIYILAAFLMIFASCSDDDLGPQVNIGPSFQITSPAEGSELVLSDADLNAQAMEVTYGAADFGYSAAVTYILELDAPGGDFSSPVQAGTSNNTSISVPTGTLNNAVLSFGGAGGFAAGIQGRVVARINETVDSIVSNTINLTVTPFAVQFPFLHVPGGYQGWNPADSSTIIYSVTRDGKYDGYIYFGEPSQFKLTDGPSWDVNWGDDEKDGILNPGGIDNNLEAMEAGMHRIKANLNDLSYSVELTNWGVIGDATPTGWDGDTDMAYDASSGTLKVTMDLQAGEIKFRANDDWALNYGDNDGNLSLEEGGENIKIDAPGNYTIELILNVPTFTYNITPN